MKRILVRDTDAAEMLGIGRATFWKYVAPKLTPVRIGRATRWAVEDVENFAKAAQASAP